MKKYSNCFYGRHIFIVWTERTKLHGDSQMHASHETSAEGRMRRKTKSHPVIKENI